MLSQDMDKSIGEAQINPQVQQQVTPELTSPQGQQQIQQRLGIAMQQKQMLDFIFKGIATKMGAEFSSRTKNPETIVQKIGQKRLQGRDYGLDNVNDIYGSRIIIKSEKTTPEIKKLVEKAADLGIFKIGKSEMVDIPYHKAYHIDFQTKEGTPGELQILTGKEEANSVVNHDLRSVHGEKMPPPVTELANKQAKIAKGLSNDRAHSLAQNISQVHKQSGDKPLPPQVNASLLAQVALTKS